MEPSDQAVLVLNQPIHGIPIDDYVRALERQLPEARILAPSTAAETRR